MFQRQLLPAQHQDFISGLEGEGVILAELLPLRAHVFFDVHVREYRDGFKVSSVF